jgi:hypothetical protein
MNKKTQGGKPGGGSAGASVRKRVDLGSVERETPDEELRYDEADNAGVGDVEETARYIADMVGALASMAGEAKLDLLTYLLNMARVEAELQARQTEDDPQDDPDDDVTY